MKNNKKSKFRSLLRLFSSINSVHVFWWSLNREDKLDNFGDILAPYLISKLTLKKISKVSSTKDRRYKFIKNYLTIGSIISLSRGKTIVWGSGIIKQDESICGGEFLAVRGPRTHKRLVELGFHAPQVYGDPAILLPLFYNPNIKKKYELGIIGHYVDNDLIKSSLHDKRIKIINLLTHNVEETICEILECERIVSSSLHGVIVSHSYNIPAVWIKLSNNLSGDDVKFFDYFESVDINYQEKFFINNFENFYSETENIFNQNPEIVLPNNDVLKNRSIQLISVCPFINKKIKAQVLTKLRN